MSFVLLLLYIVLQDGKAVVRLEQVPFRNVAECAAAGKSKITVLNDDPNFINGLFAGCVELPAVEAKK